MEDFEIRKVTEDDFESLVDLYCSVWPEGKKIHRQKATFVFRESAGISYCAVKDGRIVGGRSSFYMPLFYGKRSIKCVQFADSCIHESCRRRGLFLRMNMAFLHDFFDKNEGDLVFNISVDNSRKAYEKLGWVYLQSLTGFVKYVRPIHMLRLARFNPRKLHGAIEYDLADVSSPIDEELLSIRERLMVDKQVLHINYNKESLEWRLKSGNGIKVRSIPGIGSVVYKVGHKANGISVLAIGEVFLFKYSRKDFKRLEMALIQEEKPDMIIAKFSLAHPVYPFLLSDRFKGRFDNHGVKVVSDEMRAICLRPENWAISFFDIDTF